MITNESIYFKQEKRSLLSLLGTNQIQVHAANLVYFIIDSSSIPESIAADLKDVRTFCQQIRETSLGNFAQIFLPIFENQLYTDRKKALSQIIDGITLAKYLGVKAVSLGGVLPAVTNYGQKVISAFDNPEDFPRITTGHAATAVSVVLNIQNLLQISDRDITQEHLGVLGVGSIGKNSLKLLLKCTPHPKEITLCDLFSKVEALESFKQELVKDFGFAGKVHFAKSEDGLPQHFYDASLILGAVTAPDILDIARLNPGTIIVDDSAPHCFNVKEAFQRFQEQRDILFTEGGLLKLPEPAYVSLLQSEILCLPEEIQNFGNDLGYNTSNIFSCMLGGLLSSYCQDLKPTIGDFTVEESYQYYEKIRQLGLGPADPVALLLKTSEIEVFELPKENIENFRQRFSRKRVMAEA